MIANVLAFLAVATTVAIASPCGVCGGYIGTGLTGGYLNAVPAVTTGILGSGVACASPVVTATTVTTPILPALSTGLGGFSTGVVGSGFYGSGFYGAGLGYGLGSTLGGCGSRFLTSVC